MIECFINVKNILNIKKTAKEWYKQSAKIVILTRHTFQSSKVNFEYYCWT